MNNLKIKPTKEPDVSERLYGLIDRLQACALRKYPNRPWINEFYFNCALAWRSDLKGLEQRVLKLEAELSEK